MAMELNFYTAPETTFMATPELVQLWRKKPGSTEYVPHLIDVLMPTLSKSTAGLWVERLQTIRAVLILSWLTYLLVPSRHFWVSGTAYTVGALAYAYSGTIGLMFNLAHSAQGGILFILSSIFAVPFLGSQTYGPRAARWLRRFLYIGVLVPIYLFSGVSKFRYKGVMSNLSGHWIHHVFRGGSNRSAFPALYRFIGEHKWASMFFSHGNIVVEYLLPLAVMLWMDNWIVLSLFHVSCILFHVSIFLLMGPNFLRYCLMHILAWNPFGWCCKQRAKTDNSLSALGPSTTRLDWFHAVVTVYVIVSWFWVQVISDFQHLTGRLDPMKRRNPYFPFAELSMFAAPTKTANFLAAFVLVVIAAIVYAYTILFQKTRGDYNEAGTKNMLHRSIPHDNESQTKIDEAKFLSIDERMELAREGPTLIYDGICNLCNGSMSWFQEKCRDDSKVWYMWAQHPDTHEFLNEVGISRQDILRSWAYIKNGIVYRGSTAWLIALSNLRAPWCYISTPGKLCPTFLREAIYNFVAANRYNALGHSDSCQRPNPAMKARFLHNTSVRESPNGTIPPPERKRVLVIGCGPAGLFVAKKLASRRGGSFSVVVVEPKDYYEFTPGILRGMCSPSTMKDLVFELEPVLCQDLGITFVQGIVIDLGSNRATVRRVPGGVYRRAELDMNRNDFVTEPEVGSTAIYVDFDYCVVASGSQYATTSLWKVQTSLDGEELSSFDSYSLTGRMNALKQQYCHLKQLDEQGTGCISIMGAGLVGVELAAELRHFFPNIRHVKLFDPMATVLSQLAVSAQTSATKWLQDHNVELVVGNDFTPTAVAAAEQESDVVFQCIGIQTRAGFLPRNVLDNKGQVRVNAAMQVVRDDQPTLFGAGRIFAIGDCVTVEGASTQYCKDIYPAEAMAAIVVKNIRHALTIQCIQTRPGTLNEIKPLMSIHLCSLGPNDCLMTFNQWQVVRGEPAVFMKWFIQYTKMSDSRNEILGRVIWNLVPH
jgi:NADH dehydrogenase FAD-containing subunit/predicted DCC family thiol-disulfide oxidoreductase YuxK